MAERTFHQVISTFKVPRDSLLEISCPEVIVDKPTYVTGSFEGFLTEDTNYATWFLASSARPIIDDCPVSGGRVLRGIARAQRALEVRLGSHIKVL